MSLTAATQMGMVIGTAAYMAPEQAKGKPVDKRADIWAFGVVLLEMLGGRRVFDGETASETLAAVMMKEPDWDRLPVDLPSTLDNVVRRCLEKDPQERIRDIGDVRLAMKGVFDTGGALSEEAPVLSDQRIWQRPSVVATVALIALFSTGLSMWSVFQRPQAVSRGLTRFPIMLESGDRFSSAGRRVLAVSPDGRYVVYQANQQLYLRSMDQMEATPIRGTTESGGGRSATFSPDNQWIAFQHQGLIKKVAVTGGAPLALGEAGNPYGMSWANGDMIFFGQGPSGLWRVPAAGGTSELIVAVEEGEQAQSPQLLPGGEWLLFTLRTSSASAWDESQIVVQSLETDERRVLINGGTDGRFVPTGHIVYSQGNTLLAVPFELASMGMNQQGPVTLVEDVALAGVTGSAHYAISDTGMLVYVSTNSDSGMGGGITGFTPISALTWVDRSGNETRLPKESAPHFNMMLSPDGGRVAYRTDAGDDDLWIYDIARQTNQRLTFDAALETNAAWSPDGERIAFIRLGAGIFVMNADGSGQPELVSNESTNGFTIPTDFTPDGQGLVVGINNGDIGLVALEGDREINLLLETEFNETNLRLSPEGQWLAYQSDESGIEQIFVRPFPDMNAGLWQVSRAGGRMPVWSSDGSELFFLTPDNEMVVVPVEVGSTFAAGTEEPLFSVDGFHFTERRSFDVSPDGQRFLMFKLAADSSGAGDAGGGGRLQIDVVLNWFEELQDRVPVP